MEESCGVSVFVSFLRGLVYNSGWYFGCEIDWFFRIGDKAWKIIARVRLRGGARADSWFGCRRVKAGR
jgi:hypothetical protein